MSTDEMTRDEFMAAYDVNDLETQRNNAEKGKKRELKQVADALLIRRLVVDAGGSHEYSNGYAFQFSLGGMELHLCNQSTRIVGNVNRIPTNAEERRILNDPSLPSGEDELAIAFRRLFKFERFCLVGDLEQVVPEAIALALSH